MLCLSGFDLYSRRVPLFYAVRKLISQAEPLFTGYVFHVELKIAGSPSKGHYHVVSNTLYCHLFQHQVRYVPNFPTLKGDVTQSFPCPLSALCSPFPCEPLSLYLAGAGYMCAFLLTLTEYRLHSPLNHQSDCPPPPWTQLTVAFGQR